MAKASIDKECCKGCGLCVESCPKKIIKISQQQINKQGYYPAEIIDIEACNGCTMCAVMCPDICITIK